MTWIKCGNWFIHFLWSKDMSNLVGELNVVVEKSQWIEGLEVNRSIHHYAWVGLNRYHKNLIHDYEEDHLFPLKNKTLLVKMGLSFVVLHLRHHLSRSLEKLRENANVIFIRPIHSVCFSYLLKFHKRKRKETKANHATG